MSKATPLTVTDVVDAMHAGDLEKVTASSLGRIWDHVKDLKTKGFAMLTPRRDEADRTENQAVLATFRKELRSLGFGYIQLIGHRRGHQEPSFFVPGMSFKTASRLGKKYKQDSVVYGGPDADGKIVLVFMSGQQDVLADTFTPRAIEQSFSELAKSRGKHFTFVTRVAGNQAEFLAATVYERSKYVDELYDSLTSV